MTSESPSTLDFDRLSESASKLGVDIGLSEAHGTLCGMAGPAPAVAKDLWLNDVMAGTDPNNVLSSELGRELAGLAEKSLTGLAEADLAFMPWLPDDGDSLERRVESLAEFCHGFLHGLAAGFVAAGADAQRELPTPAAREVYEDFVELSKAAWADSETEEEGESAYAELVEYVRVSVQLVYEDLQAEKSSGQGSPATH